MTAKVEIDYSPELKKLGDNTNTLLAAAIAFVVRTEDDYQLAAENLKAVKAEARRIETERMGMTRPLDAAKKTIMDHFRPWETALSQAETAWKQSMGAYQAEQRRLREEAERRAAEAARKERERLAAEAAKREEAARKERERAEAKARELEEAGKTERAAALRVRAEERAVATESDAQALQLAAMTMPTAPVVHMPAPKAAGVSSRTIWKHEVTDLRALARAVADGIVPPTAILPNDSYLGQRARADKEHTNIPGVRVFSDTSVAVRA